MNEQRLEALKEVTPSMSVARGIVAQTESMGDETFRELVAFKTIERAEKDTLEMLIAKVQDGEVACTVADVIIGRIAMSIEDWACQVLEVMVLKGCLDVTMQELNDFYARREEAQAMEPKGVAVRYPR